MIKMSRLCFKALALVAIVGLLMLFAGRSRTRADGPCTWCNTCLNCDSTFSSCNNTCNVDYTNCVQSGNFSQSYCTDVRNQCLDNCGNNYRTCLQGCTRDGTS